MISGNILASSMLQNYSQSIGAKKKGTVVAKTMVNRMMQLKGVERGTKK